MTDQRYDGPDGAKRLEMLEKLARLVWPYLYGGSDMPTLEEMCDAIDDITWDNERVDRLEKAIQDEWYEQNGRGTDDGM